MCQAAAAADWTAAQHTVASDRHLNVGKRAVVVGAGRCGEFLPALVSLSGWKGTQLSA
jgi:hypothetical protein